MKTFEEAITMISTITTPFEKEPISLEDADGRILAENIYADRDYPPFNRAAMDGYAIMQSDWEKGVRKYRIIEVIYTGQSARHPLISGACYKIMTGAATPETADIIIRREDAQEFKNLVILQADTIKPYQNIARKGEDTRMGALLISSPVRCTPQVISLLATVGKALIEVYTLPKVALITTGDEVVSPAANINPLQIRNSNQYLLRSLLKKWNIRPALCEHVSDNKAALKAILDEALKNEIIIINGGVSAGDADHVPDVLHELGAKTLFHKVSIRPGKPLLVATMPSGAVIFALPGNPLSCLTTFTLFVEHYFYQCSGYDKRPVQRLPILGNRSKKHQLTEFFPVNADNPAGLNLLAFNGSGDVTASIHAHGLAMQASSVAQINAGDIINFYSFNN